MPEESEERDSHLWNDATIEQTPLISLRAHMRQHQRVAPHALSPTHDTVQLQGTDGMSGMARGSFSSAMALSSGGRHAPHAAWHPVHPVPRAGVGISIAEKMMSMIPRVPRKKHRRSGTELPVLETAQEGSDGCYGRLCTAASRLDDTSSQQSVAPTTDARRPVSEAEESRATKRMLGSGHQLVREEPASLAMLVDDLRWDITNLKAEHDKELAEERTRHQESRSALMEEISFLKSLLAKLGWRPAASSRGDDRRWRRRSV